MGISHWYSPKTNAVPADQLKTFGTVTTDAKAVDALTKAKKAFCGTMYVSPEGRVKYLVSSLLVQPVEDGPSFLLGNASNDPTQRKPVIIPVDVMRSGVCLIKGSDSNRPALDGYCKVGDAFTKASCNNDTLQPFLTEADDVSYLLAIV